MTTVLIFVSTGLMIKLLSFCIPIIVLFVFYSIPKKLSPLQCKFCYEANSIESSHCTNCGKNKSGDIIDIEQHELFSGELKTRQSRSIRRNRIWILVFLTLMLLLTGLFILKFTS